ncbi:MAG: NUDIX hydrolase [Acidobacteriota bacterium]|nr:NUDIX hydrolase [Acidobacteriota bacterium]
MVQQEKGKDFASLGSPKQAISGKSPLEICALYSLMQREFPEQPIVCVGGVTIRNDMVLLIRRGKEPNRGQWTLPGGMLALGERLATGVRREVQEETGIRVKPISLLAVFERIVRKKNAIQFHYVVADYLCAPEGGRLRPASDVLNARWVRKAELARYSVLPSAMRVIRQGYDAVSKLR